MQWNLQARVFSLGIGGMVDACVVACKLFSLTDLCIHGQVQRIRQLKSHYEDQHIEQPGVHPRLGVHLHYACGGTYDRMCNTNPGGHDCEIMVGLFPWDPERTSRYVGPRSSKL